MPKNYTPLDLHTGIINNLAGKVEDWLYRLEDVAHDKELRKVLGSGVMKEIDAAVDAMEVASKKMWKADDKARNIEGDRAEDTRGAKKGFDSKYSW